MKPLLVTLADENYLDQAKQLFSSAYFNAAWEGDYMLLDHEVKDDRLSWFREKGIHIKHCREIHHGPIGRLPSVTTSRFYCFSPEMLAWDHIVYFDADVIVRSPLSGLLSIREFAAVAEHYPLRRQFKSPGADVSLWMDLASRYDLDQPSFNGGMMSFPTRLIDDTTFDSIVGLFDRYNTIHDHQVGEQPTLNLHFHGKWIALPYGYNAHPIGIRQYFGKQLKDTPVVAVHFATEKPWKPSHAYFKEWKRNLDRAESIDLTTLVMKPAPASLAHSASASRILTVPPPLEPPSHEYAGYGGPWIERYFAKYWARRGEQDRVTDRVLLPVFWTDYYVRHGLSAAHREIQQYLDQQIDPARRYFTVVQNDDGVLERLPPNVLVFGAGSGNVPIPLLKEPLPYENPHKSILCSFMGNLDTGGAKSRVRHELFEALKNEKSIHFGRGDLESFYEITRQSVFTLCPRGYGRASFRFYEAMALGSIPIYVWDDIEWLPYRDSIDWTKLCVSVPVDRCATLPAILRAHTPAMIAEMQANIRAVYDDYFTYPGVARQIEKALKSEFDGPGPSIRTSTG